MAGARIGWKLVLAVFTFVVSLAARKAVTSAWKLASGGDPPRGPKAGYVEVVSWAVASGAAAALAKRYAEQRAAQYWLNSTGTLPPGYGQDELPGFRADAERD